MNIPALYKIYQQHSSVQTDTRKLQKNDLFFALKGDNFNGNKFAKQAIEMGAAYAVIDDETYAIAGKTILVDDVLYSLQQLAKYHREQFNNLPDGRMVPFLAITGSNGKTTTKELIHAVLSSTFKTYTTEGNLNNHIGVPLTLLKIKMDAEVAVIEMGANHLHEIESYCRIAQPTHGLLTNCGKAHLEGFGSVENIKKAKGELFDFLRTLTHGVAFVMWDYEYLHDMSKGISGIIKYGTTGEAHVIGKAADNKTYLDVQIEQGLEPVLIRTHLVGNYNLPNVLAAVTVGKTFEVPEAVIVAALENYRPSNSRSQLINKGSNQLILDAYNANPSSMRLAIENFAGLPAERKIVMLGAMAELGNDSVAEHQAIVNLLEQYDWTDVVLVGGNFLKIKHPYRSFATSEEAGAWLRSQAIENTSLLVKGSRSMQMEKVIDD